MNGNVQEKLVAFARQIAVQRGTMGLVNGLKPIDQLCDNLIDELDELEMEAHSPEEEYHEFADILYYVACIEEQVRLAILKKKGDLATAHDIAVKKYAIRAASPNSKDKPAELEMIRIELQARGLL